MKTIIRECKTDGSKWTGRTPETVIRRVFGARAYFRQDNGLPTGYGQIFIDNPNTGNGWSARSVTGRVRIDTD